MTFGAQRVTSESQDTKGIIQEISNDNEIQFHWSMLSSCFDNYDHEPELPSCIIRLWLSNQGHSVAGQWMEEYKQHAHVSTKGKKSLRKTVQTEHEQ